MDQHMGPGSNNLAVTASLTQTHSVSRGAKRGARRSSGKLESAPINALGLKDRRNLLVKTASRSRSRLQKASSRRGKVLEIENSQDERNENKDEKKDENKDANV